MSQKSYRDNKNKLYLVPTPLGNLGDITVRSIEVLKMVDIVFCEDTRVTKELLKHFKIIKKLASCHEYNESNMIEEAKKYLDEGQNIALVTDQGTPIISDPGYKVVSSLMKAGYDVISLPGPTAFVPALTVSGLPPQPFLFYGFLNSKKGLREKELKNIQNYPYTMIFYEAPHRIDEMLQSLLEIFGNRRISISREISKMYEEIYQGTIEEVQTEIKDGIKGEIVVVVEGNQKMVDFSALTVEEHVNLYMEDGLSSKEAIKKVATERNIPKSIVYNEYHKIRK